MNAERILVIGCGGSGKSTFARELGRLTGLPVIHLDRLYWKPGWVPTDPAAWRRIVEKTAAGDRWIMDGNYGGTLDLRLEACDAVIFLDFPRWLCLARVLRRRLANLWRGRADIAPGCPERLTWEFLAWIWRYRRSRRPGILRRLERTAVTKAVRVLPSRAAVRHFCETFPRRSSA